MLQRIRIRVQNLGALTRVCRVNFPVLAFEPFGNVNTPAALVAVEVMTVRAKVGDRL